jgi:hypothetical protein
MDHHHTYFETELQKMLLFVALTFSFYVSRYVLHIFWTAHLFPLPTFCFPLPLLATILSTPLVSYTRVRVLKRYQHYHTYCKDKKAEPIPSFSPLKAPKSPHCVFKKEILIDIFTHTHTQHTYITFYGSQISIEALCRHADFYVHYHSHITVTILRVLNLLRREYTITVHVQGSSI